MAETITIKEIMQETGLSRQTLYKRFFNTGLIPRVSKGAYDAGKARDVIAGIKARKETIAPTRTGVAKDKLALLEEWGIISKEANGRYSPKAIQLAKSLNVHVKGNRVHITRAQPRAKAKPVKAAKIKKEATITLGEMAKQSGMTKPTLLHYIRQGKIAKIGDTTYDANSFNDFLKEYKELQDRSLNKRGVMERLGINEDEYANLLSGCKLEKASFERYTKDSVEKLAKLGKEKWDEAPTYENQRPRKAYTYRDLPESELMTYQEVADALGRKKSTIVHLVKEGKLELVRRNRYSRESVEAYLKSRDFVPGKDGDSERACYTAKEVKNLLGIDKRTGLTYYVKNGLLEVVGRNKYTKESVDRYLDSKKIRRKKNVAQGTGRKPMTISDGEPEAIPTLQIEDLTKLAAR